MPEIQQGHVKTLNAEITKARFRSALLTIAIVIPIVLTVAPSLPKDAKIFGSIVLSCASFGFLYQLAFGYLFGRKIYHAVPNPTFFEWNPDMPPVQNSLTDSINMANGYGPGIGFIVAKLNKD